MAPIDEILYGKLQASSHCRLANPLLKFGLAGLTLLVGTLFVGVRFPDATNAAAVAEYETACRLAVKYLLLLTFLLFLDFRNGKIGRSVVLAMLAAGSFLTVDLLAPEEISATVQLLQGSPVGSFLEPLQFLVFVTFLMAVPLVRLTSSRDALVYARIATAFLLLALILVVFVLGYQGLVRGQRVPLSISVALVIAVVTVAAVPVGRDMTRKVFSTGLLVIMFMYYFVVQTLGPRLPGAASAGMSRWRLLKSHRWTLRLGEAGRAFGRVLGIQLSEVVDSSVSLIADRQILTSRADGLLDLRTAEDGIAVMAVTIACLSVLSEIVNIVGSAVGRVL